MTLVTLFSVKGAPGVTTLACLLGAAWPGGRPVVLVEADPAGGDLAARFGLSSRVGWTSLVSSTRRSGGTPSLDPHLQTLPGELPVLVAARGDERRPPESDEGVVVRAGPGARRDGGSALTIVDLGRLGTGDDVSEGWLAIADVALLVVRGDAASSVQVRDRIDSLADLCRGRLGAVVVGGSYSVGDLENFTGVRPVGDIPFDVPAADVASGGLGPTRRLQRSPLWSAVVRMAAALDTQLDTRIASQLDAPIDAQCDAPIDGGPVRDEHRERRDFPGADPDGAAATGPVPPGRRPFGGLRRRGDADARRRHRAPDPTDDDDRRVDV